MGFCYVLMKMILSMLITLTNKFKKHFYQESKAYYRILYLWAKGLFSYKQGQQQAGKKQMEEAIHILQILECHSAADYYTSGMQDAIKGNDN